MAETDHQQIDTEQEAKATGTTDVELWLKKIEAARDDEKDWRDDAEDAIKVYEADKDKATAFNLFHSNIETLVPALYNTTPIPDVRRRFGDKDPVAKMGADIIERSISYSVDQYPFDNTVLSAVRAAAVPGRGTARVRYKPQMVQQMDPNTQQPVEVVGYQEAVCEPVAWDKWGRGPGCYWEEVPFVWFDHDMDKQQLAELVGQDLEALKRITAYGQTEKEERGKKKKGILKTIRVHEVWDKASRSIIFITPVDKDFPLKVEKDVLDLPDFFPVPEPLQVSARVGSLVPVCPYKIYKPLLDELEKITKRISKLISQLKVRGIVDKNLEADINTLSTLDDGNYVAAKDATQFATGGGGLEKAIHHFPLDPIVAALQQLYQQREQIKATIYEVTGISDILRGSSDPNETATAQQIKQEWGSLRVKMMQGAVARFARDLFRMKAAIISKHFTPQNISMMTSLPSENNQQDAQTFPAALQLLKQDSRSYRIDIETDSTVRADLAKAQEQMTAFLTATGGFATSIGGLVQTVPQIIPPAIEVYSQFARRFKLGKQAEDALEGLSALAQQAQQQMEQGGMIGPPPSPEQEADKAKAEGERQRSEQQAGLEKQKFDMEAERENAKHQRETERFQMEQAALAEQRAHEKEAREHEKMMRAADFDAHRSKYDDETRKRQMEMEFDDTGDAQAAGDVAMGKPSKMAELTSLVASMVQANQVMAEGIAALVAQDRQESKAEMAALAGIAKQSQTDTNKQLSMLGRMMAETQRSVVQAMNAPRQVKIERIDGKISGAVSVPQGVN